MHQCAEMCKVLGAPGQLSLPKIREAREDCSNIEASTGGQVGENCARHDQRASQGPKLPWIKSQEI
jgi:hypothetical protein